MKSYKQIKKELLKDFWEVNFRDLPKKPNVTIARKFVQTRIHTGMSQAEFAKRAKTSQSAIARFESGKSNPSINLLHRLAQALGYDLIVRLD